MRSYCSYKGDGDKINKGILTNDYHIAIQERKLTLYWANLQSIRGLQLLVNEEEK